MTNANNYKGLTDKEVVESRIKHGSNILTPKQKEPLWLLYLKKYKDPLIIILLIAGMLSIGISCYEYYWLNAGGAIFFEPVGIFVAILLATGLSFVFETLADKEFSILNHVNDEEPVQVIRNGHTVGIPQKDVVVGDILLIETGEEVPADAELLEAVTLKVDESTLTGEPICDKSADEADYDKEATFPTNHVMRGTKVMEGHGVCRVYAVGDKTENGKVFVAAQIDNSVKTPLNEQLDKLGRLISNISYTIAGAIIIAKLLVFFNWEAIAWTLLIPVGIFFYLIIFKFRNWKPVTCIATIAVFFTVFIGFVLGIHEIIEPDQDVSTLMAYALQTIMIAVTLIVVAVPEGLPMAVTLSLAYSMRRMLKSNNLVRKMHACETMGATTVICTDKTGTLTKNQMQVYKAHFYDLQSERLGNDYMSDIIAEGIAVNSTAHLDFTDTNKMSVLGNPTEGALLLWLYNNGINYVSIKNNVKYIDEIPFSTERKYMATLIEKLSGEKVLYVKGAPEIVYSLCNSTCNNIAKEAIDSELTEYQNQAMRTLGFAYRIIEDNEAQACEDLISTNSLTFLGIVAISDPVREDVPAAVKECMDAGISIKIVTGDTSGTAKEIGRQIGLWTENDTERNIITGPEFAALTDEELTERIMDLKIISRARPMDKKRLVETLQKLNQVVAVTGDGTNDAPALNTAHVGLSMGDGTAVAKEASDITIVNNSFTSISRAVMWGRSLYRNIQRFLLFQLTVNVAACLIVLIGAFMGTKSPLTVTQMLWVNLIMDTFGAIALASLPPNEMVMNDKPRKRTDFILDRSMIKNIIGVGVFFFTILVLFLYIFMHTDISQLTELIHEPIGPKHEITPYEQTLLFSIFVWTHLWYMFNTRGYMSGGSGLNLKGCNGFIYILCIITAGQIIIVEIMPDFFNCTPMHWKDWLIIVCTSSLVMWIREARQITLKRLKV
ncbi:MAG: cation-translocating P-type ATPase [Prevotellaceae bacterium]|nr:cation-translocating P-type ATPase [Prevotellaceae bacterium]